MRRAVMPDSRGGPNVILVCCGSRVTLGSKLREEICPIVAETGILILVTRAASAVVRSPQCNAKRLAALTPVRESCCERAENCRAERHLSRAARIFASSAAFPVGASAGRGVYGHPFADQRQRLGW